MHVLSLLVCACVEFVPSTSRIGWRYSRSQYGFTCKNDEKQTKAQSEARECSSSPVQASVWEWCGGRAVPSQSMRCKIFVLYTVPYETGPDTHVTFHATAYRLTVRSYDLRYAGARRATFRLPLYASKNEGTECNLCTRLRDYSHSLNKVKDQQQHGTT